jgi:hypothetical protein
LPSTWGCMLHACHPCLGAHLRLGLHAPCHHLGCRLCHHHLGRHPCRRRLGRHLPPFPGPTPSPFLPGVMPPLLEAAHTSPLGYYRRHHCLGCHSRRRHPGGTITWAIAVIAVA